MEETEKSNSEKELDKTKKKLLRTMVRSEMRNKIKSDVIKDPERARDVLREWLKKDKE